MPYRALLGVKNKSIEHSILDESCIVNIRLHEDVVQRLLDDADTDKYGACAVLNLFRDRIEPVLDEIIGKHGNIALITVLIDMGTGGFAGIPVFHELTGQNGGEETANG